jgi:hypothetical protein
VNAVGEVGADIAALARLRLIWRYALGGLWLLDALLQAQPRMFSAAGLPTMVVLPAAQGQPGWIAGPMLWGAEVWASHAAAWNAAAVALEALIGCLILTGRWRPAWGRAGLALSIVWALFIWYFGEGLGGLFVDSPTYLSGAPGSAFLYMLLAAALLLPDIVWTSPRLLTGLRVGAGCLWAVGALLQLAPVYWTPLGLVSVLQMVAMMPLPLGLTALDAQLAASMAAAPGVWNAALFAVMGSLALVLLLGRALKPTYILTLIWFALVWIVLVWMVFQGLGMLFSGMATDPNTPPLWALLLLPGWFASRAQPARQTDRQRLHSQRHTLPSDEEARTQ